MGHSIARLGQKRCVGALREVARVRAAPEVLFPDHAVRRGEAHGALRGHGSGFPGRPLLS